jgi:anaerobic carbon-monoxide dehydrogenase catalytic subunit
MISTDLQDILFGCPVPVAGEINLGVLKEDKVNIIIHGHEPLLPEMIYVASQEPEAIQYAQNKGAKGIQLAGMCCSANEILMRHGIPVAGNYLQQELAIITGAVDAMVVDVQCEMQSLANVAACYHTKLITTDPRARIEGETMHIPFDEHHALDVARQDGAGSHRQLPQPPGAGADSRPSSHGGGLQLRDHPLSCWGAPSGGPTTP